MGSKLLWGFTLGLITGLLLAPEKGSETRRKISRKANDLKDKFDDFVDSISEKLESLKRETEEMQERTKPGTQTFAGDAQSGVL